MNAVTRILLRTLSRAARPYLKTFGLLRVKKIFNKSALEWQPAGERVVVLAPHMDDEIIGCGGTLARHLACGAQVTVVFLTDGRRGLGADRRGTAAHRDGADANPAAAAITGAATAGIIATRKEEALRALGELGISHIEFLDGEDGALATAPGLGNRLRELLLAARPDIVYLPFFLEEHPDHRAASMLLSAAVNGTELAFRCHGYEVWTPLFPNCFVRIDATIDAKRQALRHYQSQLADADYLHTSLALNAFRSSALSDATCRYVEAFYAVSLSGYLELYRSYGTFD